MATLNQLWVRIVGSVIFAVAMSLRAGLCVYLLRQKGVGFRKAIFFDLCGYASEAIASFIVAWEIYHRGTLLISIGSLFRAVFALIAAYYLAFIIKDICITLSSSERLDRLKQDKEAAREQKVLLTNSESFRSEQKSTEMLHEVLRERRG